MSAGVFIIAEAGVNHNGDPDVALKLVDEAAMAGADAIKFQTFSAERLVSRDAQKAAYQKITSGADESQYEMLKRLELSPAMHVDIIERCRAAGIKFLSTPFDIQSMDYLLSLGLDTIKIPSGEITNLPYLRHAGASGRDIILSTGMSTLEEVRAALDVLVASGARKESITVLHCNTEYPTLVEDANLRAMLTIRDALEVRVGYSDHTLGVEVAVAAVAMGAEVIEKHFTLDKSMPGPDHRASLEPDELVLLVRAVRNTEMALGDGVKRPSPSERSNLEAVRKSVVALRAIKEGDVYTEENITAKRPGTGISPMLWDNIIGKRAKRDFSEGEAVEI